MNKQAPCFNLGQIESLSKVISNYITGSEITKMLSHCCISDNSGESTKWRRLESCFIERQNCDQSPNAILRFVQEALQPVLYINEKEKFENFRNDVNQVLITSGLEVQNDGNIHFTTVAKTIDEVKRRTQNLERLLRQRNVHESVLRYCKEELLQENYFHSVFEAAKSLSDRVRELTFLTLDGSKLFNEAFKIDDPYLALNRLETASQRNQQNGLHQMLNGITSMVRNVTAHEPRIKWIVNENEAVDILCTISFLHKQIDQCIVVPRVTKH